MDQLELNHLTPSNQRQALKTWRARTISEMPSLLIYLELR